MNDPAPRAPQTNAASRRDANGSLLLPIIGVGLLTTVAFALVCSGLALVMPRGPNPHARSYGNRIGAARQIAIALANYESYYKSYPPAYTVDSEGRPLGSWRTLILPFIEEEDLYLQYDHDQAWDSIVNQPISARGIGSFVGDDYNAPTHSSAGFALTNYVAIVGNATMFPGPQGVKIKDIADGVSNTLVIVEIFDSDIAWAEPRDLTMDEFLDRVRQGKNFRGPNRLERRCVVAYADSKTLSIDLEQIDVEKLRAALTRNGGEEFDPNELE